VSERLQPHAHVPVHRVVRASWPNPLDTSFSRDGGRWNPPQTYEVLYAACSRAVARAIAWERLRTAGVVPEDLMPDALPQLVEIDWSGEVVDVVSAAGVAAAGFASDYPRNVGWELTQPRAAAWFDAGREGVVCRSATLSRAGQDRWPEPHDPWGELALFVKNARQAPRVRVRIEGTEFLYAGP
jgi:RES domain-containing protein